jgi:hypothetical protein
MSRLPCSLPTARIIVAHTLHPIDRRRRSPKIQQSETALSSYQLKLNRQTQYFDAIIEIVTVTCDIAEPTS